MPLSSYADSAMKRKYVTRGGFKMSRINYKL